MHARRLIVLCLLASLQLARAQTIIIDNTDAGFATISEIWSSTSATGQFGTDYRYRSTTQVPPGVVEWRPTLPAAGLYEISVWYRSANDRPSNARYTIFGSGGSFDVLVDQRSNGSQWNSLGIFAFSGGSGGYVRLTSDAEPGKTIVADAVRFARVDGPTEAGVRACWLTQYQYLGKSEAQLRAIARNIRAGSMNTVYIALYSGATVYWPSKAYQAAGGGWGSGTVDYAQYLTQIFHSEGLHVGAWFEYGLALGPATHPIAVAHPDWLARDQAGDPVTGENGGFVFLSPGHASTAALMNGMVRELAENYDFDDIQLDRFRWGRKSTGREYGYEAATAALYQQQYGSAPPTNVNNSQWVAFREGLINSLMQQAYTTIKTANPNIVVSSAPTGSYGITQHMQRWSAWINGGYMDLVMPQMYQTTLSGFQTELNTQRNQAPAHLDRLGVGYRAQDDADWTVVRDQLNYARGLGHLDGCLWVYHQYTAQIAIQDEINNLPLAGNPWQFTAENPFVSACMEQLVIDNRDAAPSYVESGTWSASAQSDFFRFDSRVALGTAPATAQFSATVQTRGYYDLSIWHTASSNRDDAAAMTVHGAEGDIALTIDQRANGGRWRALGRFPFAKGFGPVLTLSTANSSETEYVSADAIRLVLATVIGDSDGDCLVTSADAASMFLCLSGPGVAAAAPCESNDWDLDADVDLDDLLELQCGVR